MKPYRWLVLFALVISSGAFAEPTEHSLEIEGRNLHYLQAGDPDGIVVLLLHGARYSSETWSTLGTVDLLAENGYFVVALDLPGYGRSQSLDVSRDELLVDILDALEIERVAVVSPSMSGQFSLPLVTRASERVSGFVPIAPAAIERHLRALRKVKVPSLIVWGDDDTIVPLDQSVALASAIADSRRLVIEDAGHACYLDRPEVFHAALLEFLATLTP